MRKQIFRPICALLCAGVLATTQAPAFAAQNISVLVNDRAVKFTDAQPMIRQERTFVPFRAIFEEMNAAVAWDQATSTITATREGRTVQFQIGKTDVAVTENGKKQMLKTDAAPFVEGNRTYVPIRFASQALGACVDWKADMRAVLIVDVEPMMKDYQQSFQTVDAYLKFAGGAENKAVTGSALLKMDYAAAAGKLPISLSADLRGDKSAAAMQLAGTAKLDTAALRAAIEKNEGKGAVTTEVQAWLDGMRQTDGQMLVGWADGKVYLQGELMTELGAAQNGWAAVSMNSVLGETVADLRAATAYDSFAHYLAKKAQYVPLRHAPQGTVDAVREFLDEAKSTFGDHGFGSSGSDRVMEGKTNGNLYRMRLSYNSSGAVTRAQFIGETKTTEGTYRAEIDQTALAYKLHVAGESDKVTNFLFDLNLTGKAGGNQPAQRPAGDITEIEMP